MEKLEAIIADSAVQTGAAVTKQVVVGLAKTMLPVLQSMMPFEALDAVYYRWLQQVLPDPNSRSVLVNAHDLLATWHTLQAEMEAARKEDAERQMRDYKAQLQAQLRSNPRPLHPITELAARDGVVLPWKPGQPEQLVGEARVGNYQPGIEEAAESVLEAQRQAREAANREAWHRLAAEHERLVDKTGE